MATWQIVIERVFDAPRERVFDAFTQRSICGSGGGRRYFADVDGSKYERARRGRLPAVRRHMVATLTHVCVITDDVERLREFYTTLLRAEPSRMHDDYVEFATSGGALSLYSRSKLEPYAPGATQPRSNRSVMVEFEVEDVDAEFERLRSLAIDWVKPPSTQPWGNRSIYLRDPDGNLVNLYTRVDPARAET